MVNGRNYTPESHIDTQRDFNWLKKWADRSHIKLKKEKDKIPHLGRSNIRYQYKLEGRTPLALIARMLST